MAIARRLVAVMFAALLMLSLISLQGALAFSGSFSSPNYSQTSIGGITFTFSQATQGVADGSPDPGSPQNCPYSNLGGFVQCSASVSLPTGKYNMFIHGFDSIAGWTTVYENAKVLMSFSADGSGTGSFSGINIHLYGSADASNGGLGDNQASWILRMMLNIYDSTAGQYLGRYVVNEWSGTSTYSWSGDYLFTQAYTYSVTANHSYSVEFVLYGWVHDSTEGISWAYATIDFQNNGYYATLNSFSYQLPWTPLSCTAGASPTVGTHGSVTTQFSASCSGGQPSYSYYWQFNDGSGATSTAQNPSHFYTCGPGICGKTFYPTLRVTDQYGAVVYPSVPSITVYCRTMCPE